MNVLDIVLLVLMVPPFVMGIGKGFISQIASLAGILAGVWLAFRFSQNVTDFIGGFTDIPGAWTRVVAFVLIWTAVSVAAVLAGRMLTKVVRIVMLGWVDRLLGIGLSACKALIIAGVVVTLLDALNSRFPFIPSDVTESSVLYSPIKDATGVVFPFLKEFIFTK